jgi:hypothetical protein
MPCAGVGAYLISNCKYYRNIKLAIVALAPQLMEFGVKTCWNTDNRCVLFPPLDGTKVVFDWKLGRSVVSGG